MTKRRVRRHIRPPVTVPTSNVTRAHITFNIFTPRGFLSTDELKDSINYDLQIFDCELDEHLIPGLPRYFSPVRVRVPELDSETEIATINEVTLRLRYNLSNFDREKMMRDLVDLLMKHGAKVTQIASF